MQTGDIILTGVQAKGWISRLIKLGARVGRYPADAARFSHAALVIDAQGTICESNEHGCNYAHASKYDPADYVLIPMGVDMHDAAQIKAFAASCVAARDRYGYVSFVACGVNCLLAHFRWRPVTLGVAHTRICSAFVADALTRAGIIWDKPLEVVMPADIWVQQGDRVAR